jgi:hypothetical protein
MIKPSTYQPPYTITAEILNRVAAILEGKRVIAPPREVQEVKNALAAYDRFDSSTPEVAMEVTPEVRLLSVLAGEMTLQKLKESIGLKDDEHFRKAYLLPALEAGLIEMTIPEKPRSSKQKYRVTDKGRQVIAKHGGG